MIFLKYIDVIFIDIYRFSIDICILRYKVFFALMIHMDIRLYPYESLARMYIHYSIYYNTIYYNMIGKFESFINY